MTVSTQAAVTPTIAAIRRDLARRFRDAGLDSPELDARILVGQALGLDHAALAAHADRRLSGEEEAAVAAFAKRRLDREPVARILGVREFWGLPFKLNAATLVPRPETEIVIETALAVLGDVRGRALHIADLDTGSGVLLLALLRELPAALGVGTDISVAALGCARSNAAALGLAGRAAFVACDHGAALDGGFDLIVANPPYVATADIVDLPPEVRDFDPRRALDGGADGLSAYRAIAKDGCRLLAPGGVLVLELGAGQVGAVSSLTGAAGLAPVAPCRTDLSGIPRALAVRRAP